ncbi:MAG: acyl-CoA dehydrogenase family protein [Gemmataceae bacterium]
MITSTALEMMWATLTQHAADADARTVWPSASWTALGQAGALGWSIPAEYGGAAWGKVELLDGYERLAGACLTSAFILSQRDAACRRILEHGSPELRRELLRPLACGGRFATVGLSQLTTSRQHGQPALFVKEERDEFILDGFMPWVTGAAEADYFITGGSLDDGRQVLLVLPGDLPGVEVGPPLELMALRGSRTAEVRCRQVRVERRWLLAGPIEKVMSQGRGAGGLETSCLALGVAGAAIDYLHHEAQVRAELRATTDRLEQLRQGTRRELRHLAVTDADPTAAMTLRDRANKLVLRATQAALTASKGTGFLSQHPAQRWARQALFFLVWSCPRPAAEAMLEYLAPAGECGP